MNFFNRLKKILLLLFVFGSASAYAVERIHTSYFNNKAVDGYDVVAYFTESKPIEGLSKYHAKYQGANWYFISRSHQLKFEKNPHYYAPQYGGHCAYAMSLNEVAPGNPPFWTIYQNKLYLNFDQEVLNKWRDDKAGAVKKANAFWDEKLRDN